MEKVKKGTFTHFQAKEGVPKFYSVTYLKIGPKDDPAKVIKQILDVAKEIKNLTGFMELFICTFEDHGYTISGWESDEGFKELRKLKSHTDAIQDLYRPDSSVTGFTGVWQFIHGQMTARDDTGKALNIPLPKP